jgi:hypothetical protein
MSVGRYDGACPIQIMKRLPSATPAPRGCKRFREEEEDYFTSKKTRLPSAPRGCKRFREEEEDYFTSKKTCLPSATPNPNKLITLKRDNSHFEIENNLRKRMRYSKPSVEETIAYLLPHIRELRRLYHIEVEINAAKSAHILDSHKLLAHEIEAKQQLISNNKTILNAYYKVTAENNRLKRELDLTKYRLSLM